MGGATPTYVTTPVKPVATPVPLVLSLQKHTHILSIGVDDSGTPLPVVTDKAIWLPTWPESHHVDVESSEPSVIDVPDFLPELRRFRGGVIKLNPSHQTTHVKFSSRTACETLEPRQSFISYGFPTVVCIVFTFLEYACVGRCVAICGAK